MKKQELVKCFEDGTLVKYTGNILAFYQNKKLKITDFAQSSSRALCMEIETKNQAWVDFKDLEVWK